jgi:hypothetical protein
MAKTTDYVREAFLFRWNLLVFLGGVAAAALAPVPGVLLPLVAAGLTYLAGLISIPRFVRRSMRRSRTRAGGRTDAAPELSASLVDMLQSLPAMARRAFQRLHARRDARHRGGRAGPPRLRPRRPRRSARPGSTDCSGSPAPAGVKSSLVASCRR